MNDRHDKLAARARVAVLPWICLAATCLLVDSIAVAQTPNYATSTTYYDVGKSSTATVYVDGLGRQVETRAEMGGTVGLVTANEFNASGRLYRTTVPFRNLSAGYFPVDAAFDEALTQRSSEPLGGVTWSEIAYKPDPLGRISAMGAPGNDYSIAGGHAPKIWYIGTAIRSGNTNIDNNGFLLDAKLVDATLDGFEATPPVTAPTVPTHFLKVTKGANGNYTQELKDVFGRTVAQCSRTGGTGEQGVLSETLFDLLGNPLFQYPPKANDRSVSANLRYEATYNTLGQCVWKKSADAGVVQMKYDPAGRLWFSQDARQAADASGLTYTVYLYDNLGRQTAVGINSKLTATFAQADGSSGPRTDADIKVRVRYLYDDYVGLNTYLGLSGNPLGLRNLYGRSVAKISYDEFNVTSPAAQDFWKHVVVQVCSYDDEGRVEKTFTRIPRMASFSARAYSYGWQGNVTSVQYFPDYGNVSRYTTTSYPIDALGRSSGMKAGGAANIVDYTYDNYGRLSQTRYRKDSDGTELDVIDRAYSLQNWPMSITSTIANMYSETMDYTGQYNGNITSISHSQQDGTGAMYTETQNFSFDLLGRLRTVATTASTLADYNENFTYRADGSIAAKQKGPEGIWDYKPTTDAGGNITSHQLDRIENAGARATAKNYRYDPNGNMVLDCSKNMSVLYDWRNMPIAFRFFNTIPQAARDGAWSSIEPNIMAGGGVLVSEVKMIYDADGNRVQKLSYKY